ncbi:FMN-binding negative transcriptional regulator [Pseudomonas sp. GV071]|jgi:transcriptional regulator|uniref:FMN-binding negative transcriptional regulator n=1 Tax=Pseudomonas sp. GV071 TaxID=2135754 RepID=UPI000D366C75|nr:FMN-binding negative transcriptional regulator [Pseudomonas sp. GV071]PTQ73052.1 PaiB family negative transcriptional regulator [Pseudomonas sp. GV071]
MYTPAAFREEDLPTLHAQMVQTPLAILVSHDENGMQASHLPLLLVPGEGRLGTLKGHFAKANPHWKSFQAGAEVLVIFPGEQAYISPGYYPSKAEHGKAVPTWNYIAIHAYGHADTFDDPQRLRQLLGELTQRHEQGRAQPWTLDEAPPAYIDSMLRAIVGFELPIERLEGKWKLGQNRDKTDYDSVRANLAGSGLNNEAELAARMPPHAST